MERTKVHFVHTVRNMFKYEVTHCSRVLTLVFQFDLQVDVLQKMCLQYQIVNSCNCSDVGLPILPEKEYENIQLCRNDDDFPDSCMFNATQECLNKLKGMHER